MRVFESCLGRALSPRAIPPATPHTSQLTAHPPLPLPDSQAAAEEARVKKAEEEVQKAKVSVLAARALQ